MKKNLLMAMAAAGMLSSGLVFGQSETNFTFGAGQTVPDGNNSGIAFSTNLTVLGGSIGSVTVSLDISGGYNGDLYAYLAGPNGGFSVLLNRVGVSNNASAFGYPDAGLNLTFSDSGANNIHFYQNVPAYDISSGTALWQPDGRNVDPQLTDPTVLGATSPSAPLNSFDATDPNGTWTLFLADLSNGGQSTVVSWGLDITTVPEPSVLALTGLGLAAAVLLVRRRE